MKQLATTCALAVAMMASLPLTATAQGRFDSCEEQARVQTGYRSYDAPSPSFSSGSVNFRISGDAGFGYSRLSPSKGASGPTPPGPRGQYSVQQRSDKRAEAYERALRDCRARS